MYPLHTGSILLDIAHAQRNELISDARSRRRARLARTRNEARTPDMRPPRRPWWWGLARSHGAA